MSDTIQGISHFFWHLSPAFNASSLRRKRGKTDCGARFWRGLRDGSSRHAVDALGARGAPRRAVPHPLAIGQRVHAGRLLLPVHHEQSY